MCPHDPPSLDPTCSSTVTPLSIPLTATAFSSTTLPNVTLLNLDDREPIQMTNQSQVVAPLVAGTSSIYSCTCCGGSRPRVVVLLPPSLRSDVDHRRVVQVVRAALKDDSVKINDMLVQYTWVTGEPSVASAQDDSEGNEGDGDVMIESLHTSEDSGDPVVDSCPVEPVVNGKSVPMDQMDVEDGQAQAASCMYEADQSAPVQDNLDEEDADPSTSTAAADTTSADVGVHSSETVPAQVLTAADPLPMVDGDEATSSAGVQVAATQEGDDGWSQVELVARLAQHVSSKPALPTMDKVQPGSSASVVQAELKTNNNNDNNKDTRTSSSRPKLGADLFQIIVDNLSPTATDTAIRALVPPDLKPARIVTTPARPTTATSKSDGGSELPLVRGAMFDFASRMDAITFWNSVRKSYVEQFLVHLTVPDVDMTFLAKPEIPSLLEAEGLPRNYEFNPPAKLKKILKRPTNEASPSPETRSHSISRQPTAAANAATASGTGATPTGPGSDAYTLPVRCNRPPGIFLGSLSTRVTQSDLVPLVPAHLQSASTIHIHPPIKLRPEQVLVGRATIALPDVPRAAELLRHLMAVKSSAEMDQVKAPHVREVVISCMPEVRRYKPTAPHTPGVSDDEAKDSTASASASRDGSMHEDDDADSAVVRNSPLVVNGRGGDPAAPARAPGDEGVVSQPLPREAFVVHLGNLKPDVGVADVRVLVPTDLAPVAVHVPDAGDTVGHARVVFPVEAEARRFAEYVKDLKREKENVLLRLAKDGCEVTVAVFPEAQHKGSGGEAEGARRASVSLVQSESLKESQIDAARERIGDDPKVQAIKESVTEIKVENASAEPIQEVADEAEKIHQAATTVADKLQEAQSNGQLEDEAGGWDNIEVASSAALSWIDQPTTNNLQDDFANVASQPPVQRSRTRNRARSVASNLSCDSAADTAATKQPNAARIISPSHKQPLVHLNRLHPETTADSLSLAFPPGMPRPTSIKMFPARTTGTGHRQIYSAGANLYYTSEHDAMAVFDVFQAMGRDGHLTGMAAPDTKVTVAVLNVEFKPSERQQAVGAAARAPSVAQTRGTGNAHDARAQSVQSRRANGAAGRSQSAMPPRAGSQDVRAQSVQPGRGGGGFDARAQSVQRPRENYGLRFSQWKEPRGSANGAGDSSMYTKNGRLKVAEPIEEVVFEPPKAAPHVAPLYHPPWSKAPPAALPVVASEPSTVSYVPGASSSAHAAATKPASKASAAKTSFFTSMTTIKLHCVHLRHLSADVTDNMLHYLIPNHWAGDQQPSAVEFKPPTETEEGSGVFRRQAKYFFNENKDARAFVEFVRDKDAKGKLVRLKQDPNKPLAVSASHAPVCVPPSAVFLYPGQVSVS